MFIRFFLFWKNYWLIAVDLRKQKAVDAESRAVQQIVFNGKIKVKVADIRVIIYYILEQPKERII